MRTRKKTKQVKIGNIVIGGESPVSIQSMTNIPIEDVEGTIRQITSLKEHGADFVRVALRNEESTVYLKKIINSVDIPIAADVHFNYKIAIGAIKAGIHKVRINPGNIGSASSVKEVVNAAKDNGVPIRIGVNRGSIDKKKYSEATPENLVKSAMEHIHILEDNNFFDIVVSIKSSEISQTIEANEIFSKQRDYPLHIGLTEAGYGISCIVQSSITIGHLLMKGLGDTIRVSMTGDPVEEIIVAKKILESVGERIPAIRIISCPTCGRTSLNILELAKAVEKECISRFGNKAAENGRTINVAVMGCEVNGPGEASEADAGVAGGGHGSLLLFAKGKKIKKIKQKDAIGALINEIEKFL